MADTNATLSRNILVDFPDWATDKVIFVLGTNFAAAGTEGFPQKKYTLVLDASGIGTQALPVPSSDAWEWFIETPDDRVYIATLASGSDLQLTTWIASALSTVAPASLVDQFAALADFDAHVADTTAVHGIADTSLLETTAGAQAKADAAEAAAIQRGNHTGAQLAATISDFDDRALVIAAPYADEKITDEFAGLGLLAWYEARFVQLKADNPVPALYDMSGNGYHLLQATAGAQPLYKIAADGKPYLYFDGTNDYFRIATNPALAQPHTIFILFRFRDIYAAASTIFDGAGGLNTARLYRSGAKELTYYAGAGLISSTNTETAWGIYEIATDGASSKIVAPVLTKTGNAGASDAAGLTLGAYGLATPGNFSAIDFRAMICFSGTLTAAQSRQVRRYLQSISGVPLVFVGDSLTLGTGATSSNGWAQQLGISLGATVSPYNLGVGGKLIVSMRNDAPYQSQLYKYAAASLATAVVFGGTNDLQAGTTPAVAHAALEQCCKIWQAQGFRVVVVNMLPRTGEEADRATYNGLIAANYTDYADALADVAADSRIGDDGDNTDLTYYNADTVHPNDAGHAIIAGIVEAAITWL